MAWNAISANQWLKQVIIAASDWLSGHLLFVGTRYQETDISGDLDSVRMVVVGEQGGN